MRISSQMIVDNLEGQDAIIAALHSNIKTGISGTPQDIQDRQRIYGANSFPPPEIKTIMELILENFEDPINKVLLIAAMVSLVIGLYKEGFPAGLIEGTSIAIALVIICTVTSLNNWFSEKRLAELVALSDKQEVAVFRGSDKAVTIDAEDLVVGDVMKFSMGEKIPADMMMVEGQDVTCNESELTGEPDSLEKVPVTRENYQDGAMSTMLAKSLCDAGVGRAIVMAVGTETVAGVITLKTQAAPEQTLLQKKLDNMAGKIGNIGLMVAIGTFLACVVRIIIEALGGLPCGCMNIFVCKEPIPNTCTGYDFADINNQVYPELLEAIIIGITVVVVAIPEGLPLAVTISLSFSSAKMQKLNNLVRKIASSETMGGATHICSDKTGTLTENSMTVMSVMAVERVTEAGKTQTDEFVQETQNTFKQVSFSGMNIWDILVEGVIWNSSAWIEKNDNKQNVNEPDYITKGNVTEQGIIKLFMKAMSPTWCLNKMSDKKDDMILCNIPFTSKRKMGSIVVRRAGADRDHEVRVYTKGAPDMLLPKCSFAINGQGKLSQIDQRTPVPNTLLKEGESGVEDTYRGLFDRTIKKFADQAYRTILVTYKDMSMEEFESIKAANNYFAKEGDRVVLEENLITVGIFGIQDPLRGTIVESIIKCRTAGIQVIMCTGDNIDTAIAISKNAGIVTQEEIARNSNAAMTGKHFREAVGGLVKRTDENGKEID
jgi:magnesium-transporting ATPase (P-type)